MQNIQNIAAYRFVTLDDVDALAVRVKSLCESLALKGTVLVSPEGINIFLAGDASAIDGFLAELQTDTRFADLSVKFSQSAVVPDVSFISTMNVLWPWARLSLAPTRV